MGADQFQQDGDGPTVEEAFHAAREQALYDYGHRGYSGSMAEKQDFVEFVLPEGVSPNEAVMVLEGSYQFAHSPGARPEWLPERVVEAYDDKWGPAVAIRTGPSSWKFVGWASS